LSLGLLIRQTSYQLRGLKLEGGRHQSMQLVSLPLTLIVPFG